MTKGFPGRLKKRKTKKQLVREIAEVTLLDDAEPITDELIAELVKTGWSEEVLKRCKKMECIYVRAQNTIYRPVEH